MVNFACKPRFVRLWRGRLLAKYVEQVRAGDVTFWGIFALVAWGVALLGGTMASFVPEGVLGGLHASRLDGANLNQLRGQMAALENEAAGLKQANAVLLQRITLNEQKSTDITQRVGALEVSVPRLVEAVNAGAGVDNGAVTASTGTGTTSYDVDGGSVSFTTTPLAGAVPTTVKQQPMPAALPVEVTPDASAFGIALGPPITEDEGDLAWQAMNAKVGTLLMGLNPILAHVEGSAGRRLVAGPITNEAAARELCGRMAKVGIACASVPFVGDPLQVN